MISLPLPLACTAGKLAPTNEVLGSYGPFNRNGGISGTSQLAAREIIRLTCKGKPLGRDCRIPNHWSPLSGFWNCGVRPGPQWR